MQACLLVHALRHHRPLTRIGLIEAGDRLAGNHTWCLHEGDVPTVAWSWLEPLARHRWSGYHVAFEGVQRRVDLGYAALPASHVADSTMAQLAAGPHALRLGCRARLVGRHHVELESGERWRAPLVVDARGPQLREASASQGWQKFLGIEVETADDHGLTEPMLMDARVPQEDGLRFQYVLPLGPRTLLIEETCFSDRPHLDATAYLACCLRYAASQGWTVTRELRRESGVLPMPWQWQDAPRERLCGGMLGGWFHPLTGYSLAEAARLADWLARCPSPPTAAEIDARYDDLRRRGRLARLLCRALFRHAEPGQRAAMLERFYRRPDAVIGRFYALQSTWIDAWRILAGAPPRGMRWRPRALSLHNAESMSGQALAAVATPEA